MLDSSPGFSSTHIFLSDKLFCVTVWLGCLVAGEIKIMANSDFFGVEVQFKLRLKLGLSILYELHMII